jgi:hypothetical protein
LKGETVVRGGFAMFYSVPKSNVGGITGGGYTGVRWSTAWITTYQLDGATPNTKLSNPFPGGIEDAPGGKLGLMTNMGKSLNQPIRKWNTIPEIQTWSLGIQHALPGGVLIDASYVGTKSTHLYFASAESIDWFPSWIEKASAAELTRLNSKVPNPFYGYITDPTATLYSPTVTASQLQKFHPQFTGMTGTGNPMGDAIYNAFQLRVEKRMSKGLQFLVSYTNSKSIDDTSVISGNTANWAGGTGSLQNPNDFKLERSHSMFDIPQVFQLSYVYQLPFGRGKMWGSGWNPIINGILGGWQTNGIWRWDTGQPLRLTTSGGRALPGGYGTQRPNLTAALERNDTSNKDIWLSQYFANPTAAVLPPQYVIGNAPRCTPNVRTPGNWQNDMSVFKSFSLSALREGARVEIRGEFYNAFNTPIFRGPVVTVNLSTFGLVNSQRNSSRQVQGAIKIYF